MKQFFVGRLLVAYLISIVMLVIMSYVAPKVFAVNDYTISNLSFDPITGYLQFDYIGRDITSSTPSMRIVNTSNPNTQYWLSLGDSQDRGDCDSSHCWAILAPRLSDAGVTTVKIDQSGIYSQDLSYPLPLPSAYSSQNTSVVQVTGWVPASGEIWTYASADAPTHTFTVSGDQTGKYSPGMRVRLSQSSTTKYFLITGVSYSSPNTTITLYGGTGYTLANSTISSPFYSTNKAPQGFPLDPTKWTERVVSTTDSLQSSPTTGSWYNNDSALNLTLPIGAWNYKYMVHMYYSGAGAGSNVFETTASTGNNSETDADLTSTYEENVALTGRTLLSKSKTIVITSKTTYYINTSKNAGSVSSLGIAGDRDSNNVVEAVSSYL
ncbi:MAG: hypothetical protein ACREHC_05525 [Candidatus Levyibacteriota bacterium]